MSKSYPIWRKVTSCIYNSNKSYGVKDVGFETILIGSSRSNSYEFLTTKVMQRNIIHPEHGKCKEFSFLIDDITIKKAYFKINRNGTATEHINTVELYGIVHKEF